MAANGVAGQCCALHAFMVGLVPIVLTTPTVAFRRGERLEISVTTASRLEVLPDLPTVGDFLPGYEATNFRGVGAPRNTPVEIINKLNREINAALADPRMKARIADIGGTVLPGSPADFGKLIAEETEKWAKVVKFAGIKPD